MVQVHIDGALGVMHLGAMPATTRCFAMARILQNPD